MVQLCFPCEQCQQHLHRTKKRLHLFFDFYKALLQGSQMTPLLGELSCIKTAPITFVLAVHLVGHSGLRVTPGFSDWVSFPEKKICRYMICLTISLIVSSASRKNESFCPASCKHKFRQWARQYTGRASFLILVAMARPFHLPCILEGLSSACPLHMENGRTQRVRISVTTV